MNPRTYKIKLYKKEINDLCKNHPEATLLEHHYRSLYYLLKKRYPKIFEVVSKETMYEIFYDVVYLDRFMRRKREDKQNTLKNKLEMEFIRHL